MIDFLLFIRMLFFAIIALCLHELAHILAANYMGARPEKMKFFLLGFSARFSGLEKLQGWERYVIYAAGSAANAIVFMWAFVVSRLSYFGLPWLEEFAFINLALCLFNFLPVLPMDGGRILHQILSNGLGILRAGKIMRKISTVVICMLFVLGFLQVILFLFNITLLCAALYIRQSNKHLPTILQIEFHKIMDAKRKPAKLRLLPVRYVIVPKDVTIQFLLERITMDNFTIFVTQNGEKIKESEIVRIVEKNGLALKCKLV